jgi:CBS domain-containing protein
MQCKDLMKRNPYTVKPTDTVQTAARVMRDKNVGFLPVCDDDDRVLGTLTDRDIVIRVCVDNRPIGAVPVEDVMTREVVFCSPDENVHDAEQRMAQDHKSRLLVCENDQLVGVISLSDVAEREELRRAAWTMREVASREARF